MSTRTDPWKGAYALAEEIDWEIAYQEYLPRIYNFFWYRVSDEALSEDLTAVTFEKAWRGRERFRRDLSAFSTWLFTIARNVAADHFRRRGATLPLESIREQADPVLLEETVQQSQEVARLIGLLSQVPARERELIAFKYGGGLNNREIARLTRLSESNVGTILNRTVERLRMQMDVDHE